MQVPIEIDFDGMQPSDSSLTASKSGRRSSNTDSTGS